MPMWSVKRMVNIWLLLFLLPTVTCVSHLQKRCEKYATGFFREPMTHQLDAFTRYDLATQYEVFICGNQVIHPPATYLAQPFAKRGESVVPFLRNKLTEADDDRTIRDIIVVLTEMQRRDVYRVSDNRELMDLMNASINRMKDGEPKRVATGMVSSVIEETPASRPHHW
jgi:hypothetical protein